PDEPPLDAWPPPDPPPPFWAATDTLSSHAGTMTAIANADHAEMRRFMEVLLRLTQQWSCHDQHLLLSAYFKRRASKSPGHVRRRRQPACRFLDTPDSIGVRSGSGSPRCFTARRFWRFAIATMRSSRATAR